MIHKIPTDEFVIVGNFQFHVVGFLSLPETVYMRFLLGFFRFLSDFSLSLRTGVLKTHVNTMKIMVPCVFSTDPKYKVCKYTCCTYDKMKMNKNTCKHVRTHINV